MQVIHWLAGFVIHSAAARFAPFLCKWRVYYADGITAGLQSAGRSGWGRDWGGRRGGLWEDGSDGDVKEKGWGFSVCPRRGGGVVTLLTYSSEDPRMDFPSESQGRNVRDEWLRPREENCDEWVISHVTLYFHLFMRNSSFTYLFRHCPAPTLFPRPAARLRAPPPPCRPLHILCS